MSLPEESGEFKTGRSTTCSRLFAATALGRHDTQEKGEGSVPLEDTRPYVYGDSLANLELHETLKNAYYPPGRRSADPAQFGRLRCARDRVPDPLCDGRPDRHERLDGPYGKYYTTKKVALALQGMVRAQSNTWSLPLPAPVQFAYCCFDPDAAESVPVIINPGQTNDIYVVGGNGTNFNDITADGIKIPSAFYYQDATLLEEPFVISNISTGVNSGNDPYVKFTVTAPRPRWRCLWRFAYHSVHQSPGRDQYIDRGHLCIGAHVPRRPNSGNPMNDWVWRVPLPVLPATSMTNRPTAGRLALSLPDVCDRDQRSRSGRRQRRPE